MCSQIQRHITWIKENSTLFLKNLDKKGKVARRDAKEHVACQGVLVLVQEAVDVIRDASRVVVNLEVVWFALHVT